MKKKKTNEKNKIYGKPKKKFSLHIHAKTHLRTVYRGCKWSLLAPVRKIMTLRCQVFHFSVKCSKHGLRGFIDAVQRRPATQAITMFTSCWQVLSEIELRRISNVCKRWANSSFAWICKEKYGSIHEATRGIRLLIVWKSSTYSQHRPGGRRRGCVLHFHTCSAQTARFGLFYRDILFSSWELIFLTYPVVIYRWGVFFVGENFLPILGFEPTTYLSNYLTSPDYTIADLRNPCISMS